MRRFLSDASHELRTPLASIRGYAEVFRLGAATGPGELERAMSRMEAEATRMGAPILTYSSRLLRNISRPDQSLHVVCSM